MDVVSPPLTYRQVPAADFVEVGIVQGCDVGLSPHFHNEDQVTFVNAGRRRFLLQGNVVERAAGTGLVIPAGRVHRSFDEPTGVACLNLYVPAATYALDAMFAAAAQLWKDAGRLDPSSLAALVAAHRHVEVARRSDPGDIPPRAGLSREGYTRHFARRAGLPPCAFSRAARLNRARALLRTGETIAAVAAEVGFVDQSHFGRWFRRMFGVTPGRYRAGWSQAYQTAS